MGGKLAPEGFLNCTEAAALLHAGNPAIGALVAPHLHRARRIIDSPYGGVRKASTAGIEMRRSHFAGRFRSEWHGFETLAGKLSHT